MTNVQPLSSQRLGSDFWKFWVGQAITTLGSSFTNFALPLLVFKLTGSPVSLALTVVAQILPYLGLGLLLGAWVDRRNRRHLMIMTDVLRAVVIATLPLLALSGYLNVWWIYGIAFINATLSIAFDAAKFAAVPGLVHKDVLILANERVQASNSIAMIAGSFLAGLLLVIIPVPLLLFIDSFSYLVSAASLALVKRSFNAEAGKQNTTTNIFQDIHHGLHYILSHPLWRSLTVLLMILLFMSTIAESQVVLFAKQWLHTSDAEIGLLFSCQGIGIVMFSLAANRLRKVWSLGQIMLGALMLHGVATVVFALTHWYWFALLAWMVRSGTLLLFNVVAYSLGQKITPNHLLGRVIIFVRVMTWSTSSLGALLGGIAIELTNNVAAVFGITGILIFITAVAFLWTPLNYAERFLSQERSAPEVA